MSSSSNPQSCYDVSDEPSCLAFRGGPPPSSSSDPTTTLPPDADARVCSWTCTGMTESSKSCRCVRRIYANEESSPVVTIVVSVVGVGIFLALVWIFVHYLGKRQRARDFIEQFHKQQELDKKKKEQEEYLLSRRHSKDIAHEEEIAKFREQHEIPKAAKLKLDSITVCKKVRGMSANQRRRLLRKIREKENGQEHNSDDDVCAVEIPPQDSTPGKKKKKKKSQQQPGLGRYGQHNASHSAEEDDDDEEETDEEYDEEEEEKRNEALRLLFQEFGQQLLKEHTRKESFREKEKQQQQQNSSVSILQKVVEQKSMGTGSSISL